MLEYDIFAMLKEIDLTKPMLRVSVLCVITSSLLR